MIICFSIVINEESSKLEHFIYVLDEESNIKRICAYK